MKQISRKQFLVKSSIATAGLYSISKARAWSRPIGANDGVNCSLEMGVRAGEIFHLANISYRSGFPSTAASGEELFAGSKVGAAAWSSMRRNLEQNGVDLSSEQLTQGSWMTLAEGGRKLLVESHCSEEIAQYLFRPRHYRVPFIMPGNV